MFMCTIADAATLGCFSPSTFTDLSLRLGDQEALIVTRRNHSNTHEFLPSIRIFTLKLHHYQQLYHPY